jgi:hypothetical protein
VLVTLGLSYEVKFGLQPKRGSSSEKLLGAIVGSNGEPWRPLGRESSDLNYAHPAFVEYELQLG